MPAHLVVKNAYSIVDDIVWVEEDPCFAKQCLIHDVKFMVPLLWKVYAFPIKKKKKKKIVSINCKFGATEVARVLKKTLVFMLAFTPKHFCFFGKPQTPNHAVT